MEQPSQCRYCDTPLTRSRQVQCGQPACKRAFDADRGREWQRRYKAEHGAWYAKANYAEQARAYGQRYRKEHGTSRQRYPAAAAAGDARRRMRMEHAQTGEVFTPLDVHTRDGWTCQLCQRPIDRTIPWPNPMSPSIDHIIPLSRGGAHAMANVQSAHLGCNSRKGDRLTVDTSTFNPTHATPAEG